MSKRRAKKHPHPEQKPQPKTSRRLIYGFIALFLIINGVIWALFGIQQSYASRLLPKTVISGVDVSGLTEAQAITRLSSTEQQLLTKPLTFKAGEVERTASLADLGYQLDTAGTVHTIFTTTRRNLLANLVTAWVTPNPTVTAIRSTVNHDQLAAFTDSIKSEVEKDAKDASLEYQNGTLVFVPSENGATLDDAAIGQTITGALATAQTTTTITLPVTQVAPALTTEAQVADARTYLQRILAQPLHVDVKDGDTNIANTNIDPPTLFSFVIWTIQDNQLAVVFDEGKIKDQITALAKKVSVKALDTKISTQDNSTIQDGHDGRQLDVNAATAQVMDNLKTANVGIPLVLAAAKVNHKTVSQAPEFQLGRFGDSQSYIEVDLSGQHLYTISGNSLVKQYSVSTGKWSTPTPLGEFTIQNHQPTAWSARFHLYMDNWMAITPDGAYGIHQLPRWPSGYVEGAGHIGTPVSHGCIRLGPGDANEVYNWAQNGTKVIIHA